MSEGKLCLSDFLLLINMDGFIYMREQLITLFTFYNTFILSNMTSRQLDFAVGHYFDYDFNLNKILSRKDVLRRILCLKQSKKVFVFRIISGELSETY
ncbi:hypothetical protein A3Q56_08412 [Intoshia linei]|uniref:Uncharacterized protein n=1 Tax=Intoshia linei TaxID=1819745 RepID=A0A177ARM0_9BILA|nr:hypothetical protein A3Q56_08412 [Intoshia linei]